MTRKTKREKLHLTPQQQDKLDQLSNSRTAPLREVQRAKILPPKPKQHPGVGRDYEYKL